jgi:hypothetical protein
MEYIDKYYQKHKPPELADFISSPPQQEQPQAMRIHDFQAEQIAAYSD